MVVRRYNLPRSRFGPLAAMVLHGCAALDDSRASVPLPDELDARSLLVQDDGAVLIGGEIGGAQPGSVHIVEGGAVRRVYEGPGRVVALTAHGRDVWALAQRPRSRPGSDPFLLHSSDGGRSYVDEGPILLRDLDQLVALGGDELWALGTDLARSTDRGETWHVVRAPGERNMVRERLHVRDGQLLILGSTVRRARDGGMAWDETEAGAQVTTAHTRWWAGVRDGAAVFAAWGDTNWTSLPLPAGARPVRLFADAEHVAVAAAPPPKAQAGGMYVLRSKDGGRNWTITRQGGELFDPTWGFGADGSFYSVDPWKRVLVTSRAE